MEDKIDNLLNDELTFVNAMLEYVAKNGTETFYERQIQEIFGFEPSTFRNMRDQMNQCCVHNPYDPGAYIVIVRECVALSNHFVSLRIHEKHTQLLSENNEIHERQMRIEKWLLAFTAALLLLTFALLIVTCFQAYPILFPKAPQETNTTYQYQETDKNYKTKKTEANPVKDIRGIPGVRMCLYQSIRKTS